ncbi:Uncharacterized protein ACO02O_03621 [Dirofilaria immitis]
MKFVRAQQIFENVLSVIVVVDSDGDDDGDGGDDGRRGRATVMFFPVHHRIHHRSASSDITFLVMSEIILQRILSAFPYVVYLLPYLTICNFSLVYPHFASHGITRRPLYLSDWSANGKIAVKSSGRRRGDI